MRREVQGCTKGAKNPPHEATDPHEATELLRLGIVIFCDVDYAVWVSELNVMLFKGFEDGKV